MVKLKFLVQYECQINKFFQKFAYDKDTKQIRIDAGPYCLAKSSVFYKGKRKVYVQHNNLFDTQNKHITNSVNNVHALLPNKFNSV